MTDQARILVLWATPRSTSTAFEWMMRQRGDFACFHEPWNETYYYGEDRRSDRDRAVAARPGHTFASTWKEIAARAESGPVFVKDFVYSVEHDLDDDKVARLDHTFLIRDPRRVLQGMAEHWPDCTWEEVGFESLHRLFHRIAERDGKAPPVMSSADLLDDPEGTARAYCSAVGIEFDSAALSWDPGDRTEVSWYGEGTGPWHDTLRASSGISKPTTTYPPLEENHRLLEMYERSLPLFEDLLAHTFDPMSANVGEA